MSTISTVGSGFGSGCGPGGGGWGGIGAFVAIVIVDVATMSPLRAVMVAPDLPDQMTFACPVKSVVTVSADSAPLEADRDTTTFGATRFPSAFAAVATPISRLPPPRGSSQRSG